MSLSRLSRRSAALTTTLLLSAIAVCAAPAAADEFFSEEHVINLSVEDPTLNTEHTYSFDLPLFDEMGGTRDLIGYQVEFGMGSIYTKEISGNPTANIVGCQVSWPMTWASYMDGQLWFPLDQASGNLSVTQGYGAIRGPFSDPEPAVLDGGIAIELTRAFDDPALLANVTGVGTAQIDCTHSLGDFLIEEPHRWPSRPGVFTPTLCTTTIDELTADLTVTYFYTPEPSSLALLGLGSVALLRRRR